MNWFNQNKALGSLLIFMVIAGAIGGYMWFTASAQVAELRSELASTQQSIDGLKSKKPYPKEENVVAVKAQKTEVFKLTAPMVELLEKNKILGDKVDPIGFQQAVSRLQAELTDAAQKANVTLPPDFAFGFRKFLGSLPAPDAVPILMQQLSIVRQLAMALIDSKVNAIQNIQRMPFEDVVSAAPANAKEPKEKEKKPASSKAAPGINEILPAIILNRPDLRYDVMPFVISFSGDSSSFRSIVNSLSDLKLGKGNYVVRSVKVTNQKLEPPNLESLGADTAVKDPAAGDIGAVMIFGEEKINVEMRVDYLDWKPLTETAKK